MPVLRRIRELRQKGADYVTTKGSWALWMSSTSRSPWASFRNTPASTVREVLRFLPHASHLDDDIEVCVGLGLKEEKRKEPLQVLQVNF